MGVNNRTGTDHYAATNEEHRAVVTAHFDKGASKDQNYDGSAGAHTQTDIIPESLGLNQPVRAGTYVRPIPEGKGNRAS